MSISYGAMRALAAKNLVLDKTTSFSQGSSISDISFFKMFGFEECLSIDINNFGSSAK